jgi:SAM-dependent methyltransferase
MPPGARVVGYDIDDHYGVADVVGGEFLPFDDASFDLAICIEGFFYIEDQAHGAAEIRRVLRPGGIAVITVPQIWQYERDVFEHRYTEPSLRAVFSDWDDVRVVENGGIVVSWALLSGILLETAASASPRPLRPLVRLVVTPLTALVNLVGGFLDRIERQRLADASGRMPANLALVARAPAN